MRLVLMLVWTPLIAQSVQVYSEFARISAAGEVTAPAQPREILSPAIIRNGFTSFQVVVRVEPGTSYWLHIGQNPEDAFRVSLYREEGESLEPVKLPYEGKSTQVFWLDLWAASDAPVRRVKVEPQLNVGRDWVEYPMEVRVMDAVVPEGDYRGALPPIAILNTYLCGAIIDPDPKWSPSMADRLHSRNALQDVQLARSAPLKELKRLTGACPLSTPPDEPEWYLKIRDSLVRMR